MKRFTDAITAMLFLPCLLSTAFSAETGDGYRGIWYEIGGAYSGGMATYPQHQMPMAVYAPAAQKTFFVYGGESADGRKNLQMMIGAFDHQKKLLANPTLVRDCATNDAHANPCMAIDTKGHIFIYCAARHKFSGRIYRSCKPYDISAFDQLVDTYMPYPQAWIADDGRHFLKYTRYNKGNGSVREIYSTVSQDGTAWDFKKSTKIANDGHYAATTLHKGRLWMTLNWHKSGSDKRTNLYVIRSDDLGTSWQTTDGKPVSLPMNFPETPSLIRDYLTEKKFIYLNDLITDAKGNPVILYVEASGGSKSQGPKGDPRRWMTARYDGKQWHFHSICTVDHNYDYGNLRIDTKGIWRAIGATDAGPHPYTTGGEVVLWESRDTGVTWKRAKALTKNSRRNHSYVRVPTNFAPEFFGYWGDGDTTQCSESDLYFCDWNGNLFRMPRKIAKPWVQPIPVP